MVLEMIGINIDLILNVFVFMIRTASVGPRGPSGVLKELIEMKSAMPPESPLPWEGAIGR
jgi:hypothetical protein